MTTLLTPHGQTAPPDDAFLSVSDEGATDDGHDFPFCTKTSLIIDRPTMDSGGCVVAKGTVGDVGIFTRRPTLIVGQRLTEDVHSSTIRNSGVVVKQALVDG